MPLSVIGIHFRYYYISISDKYISILQFISNIAANEGVGGIS